MNTIRIYIAALIGAAIFLSYIAGAHTGNIRCQARVANTTAEQIAINTKIKGKINETVLHTGVADVRRILHEKYTITE